MFLFFNHFNIPITIFSLAHRLVRIWTKDLNLSHNQLESILFASSAIDFHLTADAFIVFKFISSLFGNGSQLGSQKRLRNG